MGKTPENSTAGWLAFCAQWNRSCAEAPSPRTKHDVGRDETLRYLAEKRAK